VGRRPGLGLGPDRACSEPRVTRVRVRRPQWHAGAAAAAAAAAEVRVSDARLRDSNFSDPASLSHGHGGPFKLASSLPRVTGTEGFESDSHLNLKIEYLKT
jgi:hypothetical protein